MAVERCCVDMNGMEDSRVSKRRLGVFSLIRFSLAVKGLAKKKYAQSRLCLDSKSNPSAVFSSYVSGKLST
jgi:hypothetical protein